jgi:hypothetical protein
MALPALTRAQQPVDNQVGRVDNRVGGELYRRDSSAARYPQGQARLLPSEERNAIRRSGMLPSEYQANRFAVGPLAPEGRLNYVTTRSPLQRALNSPEPRLVNPAYDPNAAAQPGQRMDAWPDPVPGGYPQTLRDGFSASGRVPGATSLNRPSVPRFDLGGQLQQQSQPNGAPLPPIQPGPIETEPPQAPLAVPRPLQPPPSTRPTTPSEAAPPPGPVVPSLTGAPDYALPIGQSPQGTPAAALLSRSPLQQ